MTRRVGSPKFRAFFPSDSPRAQTCTFEGPRLQTPPKFSEETPKRGKKERKLERKRGKKRDILGSLPPFGTPFFWVRGPTLRGKYGRAKFGQTNWPNAVKSGSPNSVKSGSPNAVKSGWPNAVKSGWPNAVCRIRLEKIGQTRSNKIGQMRSWPNSVWPNAVK